MERLILAIVLFQSLFNIGAVLLMFYNNNKTQSTICRMVNYINDSIQNRYYETYGPTKDLLEILHSGLLELKKSERKNSETYINLLKKLNEFYMACAQDEETLRKIEMASARFIDGYEIDTEPKNQDERSNVMEIIEKLFEEVDHGQKTGGIQCDTNTRNKADT